jgi:DNA-binding MarR family transcriptional regulator
MTGTLVHAVSALIVETFRLNGRLLASGDALVADVGLTSARWQVLGAMALSPVPLPVAHIARNMGLARQTVQRLANDLEREGFVRFAANPHHQRAKLVLLTARGQAAYAAAMERQKPWARCLTQGMSARRLDDATAVLKALRQRLDEGD